MVSPLQGRRQQLEKQRSLKQHAIAQGVAVAEPSTHTSTVRSDWDLVRGTLMEDMRKLKTIKHIADKHELKAKVVPHYLPYLERADVPNDIAAELMVWLFDIGSLTKAIQLGLSLIEKGADTPERITSSLPDFIADQVLNWTEREYKAGHSVEPHFSQVFERVMNTWKPYEIVQRKYCKQAGLMTLGKFNVKVNHVPDPERLKQALIHFENAETIHDSAHLQGNSGVGTRIAEIKKRLAKLEPETGSNAEQGK